jgi:hypothetical protein
MRNSEESSSTAPTISIVRLPARVWRESFPRLQQASENQGPMESLSGVFGGVPVGVFAKIVDDAILVQYAACLSSDGYNSIPIILMGAVFFFLHRSVCPLLRKGFC